MWPQTVKLAGREYVVVPKSEFQALTKRAGLIKELRGKASASYRMTAQDKGDVAEVKSLARKNEKAISLAELRHELGL